MEGSEGNYQSARFTKAVGDPAAYILTVSNEGEDCIVGRIDARSGGWRLVVEVA